MQFLKEPLSSGLNNLSANDAATTQNWHNLQTLRHLQTVEPLCRPEDLNFYQQLCFLLVFLCIMLVGITALLYFLMRRKINRLVQIHDLGVDEELYNRILRESVR